MCFGIQGAMRLLLDTDAFCKLGAAGLLQSVSRVLSIEWSDCLRLPALTQMLQRGRLFKNLGVAICADLLPLAHTLGTVPPAPAVWLNQLTGLPDVDPGEAHLFAHVAACDDILITADKRALRAVKNMPGVVSALAGKIVLPEAALLALCVQRGDDHVRTAMAPVLALDTMFRTCFSPGNLAPRDGLSSYLHSAVLELSPLVLWSPKPKGTP